MKKHTWSKRTVLKYSLLQLPGLIMFILILVLLRYWSLVPLWSIWILIPLWIIKDVIMFPFVWRSYDGAGPAMIGSQGIADERLSPSGHVRIQGELWRARVVEGGTAIEKGQPVLIREIQGLTLIVGPGEKDDA